MMRWLIAAAIVLLLSVVGCKRTEPVIQADPDLVTSDGIYG